MGIPGNDTLYSYSLISSEIYIPTVVSSAHASRTVYIAVVVVVVPIIYFIIIIFFLFFFVIRRYYIVVPIYICVYMNITHIGEGNIIYLYVYTCSVVVVPIYACTYIFFCY